MIVNPLLDPLFQPAALTIATLLAGLLLVILVVERRNLKKLASRTLFKRWAVWAVLAPLYLVSILAGSLTALAFISVVILLGLLEYSRLVGLKGPYRAGLVVAGLVAAPAALFSYEAFLALPAILLLLAMLVPLLRQDIASGTRNLAFAALGWAYLPLLAGHLMLLHVHVADGPGILLALGVGVALSDVAAFTLGSLAGKHKLAPVLSPKKTWEGLVGNLIGAYAGVALMAFALPEESRLFMVIALPAAIAVGAVWGDLFESLMKREFAVKDTGRWLPGFGGLLDRFDSLIVVLPIGYYVARLIA